MTPVKAVLKPYGYEELERRHQRAIHLRYGLAGELPEPWLSRVKEADRRATFTEAFVLAGWPIEEARREFARPAGEKPGREDLVARPWPEERRRFLKAFVRRHGSDGNRSGVGR